MRSVLLAASVAILGFHPTALGAQARCGWSADSLAPPPLNAVLDSTALVTRLRDYLVERPEPTLAFVTFDRTGTVKAVWLPWQDEDPARRGLAGDLKRFVRPQAARAGTFGVGIFWNASMQVVRTVPCTCGIAIANLMQAEQLAELGHDELLYQRKNPNLLRASGFLLEIAPNGSIIGASLDRSSGNRVADSLAYEVIKKLHYRAPAGGVGNYFAIQQVRLH